ncbi:MAG: RNA polymerase sigma factor [Solirubrobacteraceae bacterium]
MEVSAIKLPVGTSLHGRAPFLRLQSDERLVALVRRGNPAAFELLVGRYQTRLLAFCRHMLGSREDAEDVLQEVFAAAYNAMLSNDREINLRPWLYRIARNRCLNHMRKPQALGVDSMDIHLSNFGSSTADQVHEREDFRELVSDIALLPETQRSALVLREMDALSYEQIAEAMDTTIPSVKSLLVRARVSLAEAAEARMLTCEEVRSELGAVAEGLIRKPTQPVRRHLRSCARCEAFQSRLKHTNKVLGAIMPIGPLMILRRFAFTHLPHSAGSGATAAGSGAGAGTAGTSAAGTTLAGATVAAGASVAVGSSTGGLISAGVGALAAKAFAGLAAAALVTAGAVAVDHAAHASRVPKPMSVAEAAVAQPLGSGVAQASLGTAAMAAPITQLPQAKTQISAAATIKRATAKKTVRTAPLSAATRAGTRAATTPAATGASTKRTVTTTTPTTTLPGRVDTTTIPTVLPVSATTTPSTTTTPASTITPATTTPTSTPPSTTTPATTTPTSTPPSTTTPATTTPSSTIPPSTTTPATTTPTTTPPSTTTPATTTPPSTTTPATTTPTSTTPGVGNTTTSTTSQTASTTTPSSSGS